MRSCYNEDKLSRLFDGSICGTNDERGWGNDLRKGMVAHMAWKFEISGLDGQCQLFGVNIFRCRWKSTGETARVEDPHYGQPRMFHVYEAEIGGRVRRFAAGEFSNGIWGFYLESDQ